MSRSGAVAAVDLGATSGRVMLGYVDGRGQGQVRLEHVARFINGPVQLASGLYWNFTGLLNHVTEGLAAAVRAEPGVRSVGIDSWAVDYALFRGDRMLGEPYHYRDERTRRGVDLVHAAIPFEQLHQRNGLQFLPFTTLYQLAAERVEGLLEQADRLLLIPDALAYQLTGEAVAERTNASTTGLVRVESGNWDRELMLQLQVPAALFPPLIDPGTAIGPITGPFVKATEVRRPVPVVAVGSHDTASAVAAVPMQAESAAYISCGTWGLVGVELERPVLTRAARDAGFTNERGVDGRIRFLHNVMGLWLLSESVRHWEHRGAVPVSLGSLLAEAAFVTGSVPVFDVNDPRFLPPGDMPSRIAEWCVEHDEPTPKTRAEYVRSIIESLAFAFADAARDAALLSNTVVDRIHLVGGGVQNVLLCQRIADRSGLPVYAGPVEATALGNVLVQARTNGLITGDLDVLRRLVLTSMPPRRYDPQLHFGPKDGT